MGCTESSQTIVPTKNSKRNSKVELKAITEENTSQISQEVQEMTPNIMVATQSKKKLQSEPIFEDSLESP